VRGYPASLVTSHCPRPFPATIPEQRSAGGPALGQELWNRATVPLSGGCTKTSGHRTDKSSCDRLAKYIMIMVNWQCPGVSWIGPQAGSFMIQHSWIMNRETVR
jgi:hypothetical protein